jgi:hypothetical protein
MQTPKKASNAILRPEDLANADHEVLKRLLGQKHGAANAYPTHNSHASGTGRGHSSTVTSMEPKVDNKKDDAT